MKKGMFLTFWLRTKNDYFNVQSELTEKSVYKREIKTDFVQDQDELISGGFFKLWIFYVSLIHVVATELSRHSCSMVCLSPTVSGQ